MKKLSILVLAAMSLTGCWTSIWTVAPTTEYVAPERTVYTTQVTTPTPKTTTTTTVTVTSYNNDWSFYLDLNAVAAAFAESRSVQEFEQLLNSSRYMINNLDLNRDGWVDYLRVIETHRGSYYSLLIQACLAPHVFQDVATVVAERRTDVLYVEVIGDRYLYGYNYIVRPVFVKRPPMWDFYGRPSYNPWSSPYYYGYWPGHYQQFKPVYLNHYQAYVNTYMHNHHYCTHCDYPPQPFYNGYSSMTQPHSHNDYATQHPNDSFEGRVTNTMTKSGSGVSVRNAGDLRTEVNRQTTASKEQPKTSGSASTSSSSRTSTSGVSNRTGETSSRTTTTQSAPTSSRTETQKGSATVSGSRTTTSGTSSRTSTSTPSTSSTSAKTSATTTTARPSTTVETRVNRSGESRTTIKQIDSNGRTQTIKRETNTSSRTSGSSSRTSDSSTRSTDSSTRTSGSSRR